MDLRRTTLTAFLFALTTSAMTSTTAIRDTSAPGPDNDGEYMRFYFNAARRKGLAEEGVLLLVSIAEQRLYAIERNGLISGFPVSTSRYGTGNREGSFQTPTGWHRAARYFGAKAPAGQVFIGRLATDRILSPRERRSNADEDLVVSRIIWLEGLEPGINSGGKVDSFKRYIYLHGTNQEQFLGRPASKGCVRLSSKDVIELFRLTQGRTTWCLIHPAPK